MQGNDEKISGKKDRPCACLNAAALHAARCMLAQTDSEWVERSVSSSSTIHPAVHANNPDLTMLIAEAGKQVPVHTAVRRELGSSASPSPGHHQQEPPESDWRRSGTQNIEPPLIG